MVVTCGLILPVGIDAELLHIPPALPSPSHKSPLPEMETRGRIQPVFFCLVTWSLLLPRRVCSKRLPLFKPLPRFRYYYYNAYVTLKSPLNCRERIWHLQCTLETSFKGASKVGKAHLKLWYWPKKLIENKSHNSNLFLIFDRMPVYPVVKSLHIKKRT